MVESVLELVYSQLHFSQPTPAPHVPQPPVAHQQRGHEPRQQATCQHKVPYISKPPPELRSGSTPMVPGARHGYPLLRVLAAPLTLRVRTHRAESLALLVILSLLGARPLAPLGAPLASRGGACHATGGHCACVPKAFRVWPWASERSRALCAHEYSSCRLGRSSNSSTCSSHNPIHPSGQKSSGSPHSFMPSRRTCQPSVVPGPKPRSSSS